MIQCPDCKASHRPPVAAPGTQVGVKCPCGTVLHARLARTAGGEIELLRTEDSPRRHVEKMLAKHKKTLPGGCSQRLRVKPAFARELLGGAELGVPVEIDDCMDDDCVCVEVKPPKDDKKK